MSDSRSRVIREAIRHAEVKQEAMLKLAIAADARAMTLCLVCAGIAGILVGILANMEIGSGAGSIAMMAFSFFLAAGLSAWAARPIDFASPGQDFSDFSEDIEQGRSFDDVLLELGGTLDECAQENHARLCGNARYFKAALILAVSAPLIGLFTAITI